MLPSIDFDVLEYHLQGPKEYFHSGRISYLPHNVYTNMPFNVEMLHLLAMEVMGDWWWGGLSGQLLVALFGPAAAVLIAGAAGKLASPRAAWLAALIYLSTPWVYRMAAIAYVEGPLCFYHAALDLGVDRGQGGDGCEASASVGFAGVARRLCDGLQVHGIGIGGHSFRAARPRGRRPATVRRSGGILRARLGGHHDALAGQKRARHQEPGLSARVPSLPQSGLGCRPRDTMASGAWPAPDSISAS